MTFSVSKFAAEVRNEGLLRNNKYVVRFGIPPALMGDQSAVQTARTVELWCEQAMVPGVQTVVSEVRRYGYGPPEKGALVSNFTDCDFTFIGDGKGKVWDFFSRWISATTAFDAFGERGITALSGIVANQHPYELAYRDDVVQDVTVDVFDDAGTPRIQTVLRAAFPIGMAPVPLAWGARDEYVRIPVVFSYADWYKKPLSPTTPSPGAAPPTNVG